MAAKIEFVHTSLKTFCNENAGFAISKELFEDILEKYIKKSKAYLTGLTSNEKFKDLDVTFDADITVNNLNLEFLSVVGVPPEISIGNQNQVAFTANLIANLDNTPICEFDIEYSSLIAHLLLVDKKLKLVLKNHQSSEVRFAKLWETDGQLKNKFEQQYGFDRQTWVSLTYHLKAASIISNYEIASRFFAAIVFPDFFSVFRGIKFGNNGYFEAAKLDSGEDLIMFTASSSIDFEPCPRDPVDGTIRLKPSSTQANSNTTHGQQELSIGRSNWSPTDESELTTQSPTNPDIVVEVDEDSLAKSFPVHREDDTFNSEGEWRVPWIEDGHVFLYTPLEVLKVNFDGIVKPAIGDNDRDSWGPFYYEWWVSAQLQSFELRLQRGFPITFKILVPLEVHGQGGAGIKIGSVRYQVTGANFNGRVDPFEIGFRIMLDWPRREILFESKIDNIRAHGFRFTASPLNFPLNKIFDVVLSKAAEAIINDQAGKILNSTRIPIANLQLLEEFGSLVGGLAGFEDGDGTTMGVKYLNLN